MPFHLYLHMPYCRRKCPYCDFFKKVPRTGERENFIVALLKEMKLAAQNYDWAADAPATIYFGGGTPSLHSADEISNLLNCARGAWGDFNEIEITLETNPGTVNLDTLQGYRAAGVNRLSIGAQSFHPRKLELLYRDHTVEETRECVQIARRAGYVNLSLDLIFGLPGETLEEWRQDIYYALTLAPKHVSLYNLEFHEATPFGRWKRTGRLSPIDQDLEAEMYEMTHEILVQNGFEHYEVSNFARPGYQSVHNSAYWKGRPYLGLGPSAHSFDGRTLRIVNVTDMHAYFRALDEERMPVHQSEEVNEQIRKEDWIGLQLRKSEGIAYVDAVRNLGESEAAHLWRRAALLPETLRVLTAERFHLTPAGWFQENSVLLWLCEDPIGAQH
jgi:oxygen-independent coproporphyrinogen-3 oxidase